MPSDGIRFYIDYRSLKIVLFSVVYSDVDLSDNLIYFPFWEIISVLCAKEKVESES